MPEVLRGQKASERQLPACSLSVTWVLHNHRCAGAESKRDVARLEHRAQLSMERPQTAQKGLHRQLLGSVQLCPTSCYPPSTCDKPVQSVLPPSDLKHKSLRPSEKPQTARDIINLMAMPRQQRKGKTCLHHLTKHSKSLQACFCLPKRKISKWEDAAACLAFVTAPLDESMRPSKPGVHGERSTSAAAASHYLCCERPAGVTSALANGEEGLRALRQTWFSHQSFMLLDAFQLLLSIRPVPVRPYRSAQQPETDSGQIKRAESNLH